ncbi:hypothetical protein [Flavobacterium sp. LM4]|uniref:hypothetical protein n=1 Tax=Flavobacterium sp. LM4 TaxID=1938609 RepID=UPI000993D6C2|nr:hypothetical protein [Flavobacterium sp. LM4]OOV19104.1 hypothetical protein BXU10_05380 [Flavobacterium sp. LM4]
MKKLLLLTYLFLSISAQSQDFAKDTLLVNGTQPASIIRIKNHKIFIAQNQEMQKSYIKQKDGSFVSNGVPYVEIYIDKKAHTIGTTTEYVDIMFDKLNTGPGSSNEIIALDNTRILIHYRKIEKEKKEQMVVFYPLADRFLNFSFVFYYTDDDNRSSKENAVYSIIKDGILVLEDYFLYRKI